MPWLQAQSKRLLFAPAYEPGHDCGSGLSGGKPHPALPLGAGLGPSRLGWGSGVPGSPAPRRALPAHGPLSHHQLDWKRPSWKSNQLRPPNV